MIQAVVFLGNPGKKYEKTRHNIAWLLEKELSFSASLVWQKKFNGLYAYSMVNGNKIYFLKPQTFMNLSGQSVLAMCQFFKIPFSSILVVHDDIELEFNRFVIKKGGGHGGHNGLRSVMSTLGTGDFQRLRLGVSRPERMPVAAYVLLPFSDLENSLLYDYLKSGARELELWLENDK